MEWRYFIWQTFVYLHRFVKRGPTWHHTKILQNPCNYAFRQTHKSHCAFKYSQLNFAFQRSLNLNLWGIWAFNSPTFVPSNHFMKKSIHIFNKFFEHFLIDPDLCRNATEYTNNKYTVEITLHFINQRTKTCLHTEWK